MARRSRKKIKVVPKLWELPDNEIDILIDKLKRDFPNSGLLVRYTSERSRRDEGVSIEDFYKVEDIE